MLAGLLLALAALPDDGPWVVIEDSRGAAIAGAPALSAGRVELEVQLHNRLPVRVTGLVFTIQLETAGDGAPIPGWRLEQAFDALALEADETRALRIDRALPARRTVPEAAQIRYSVALLSYRLAPPRLDLVRALIESSAEADQRAALAAYEGLGALGLPGELRGAVRSEIREALLHPASEPDATQALRLALAVRAAGDLEDGALVAPLLELPATLELPRWSAAWAELAARLQEGSDEGAPRLGLLRTLTATGGESASEASVADAIVRIGAPAVPELVRARALASSPRARGLAARLLHALGRGTSRAQLAIADPEARSRLVEVWGELGLPEPVPALVELLGRRTGAARRAPLEALKRIGPRAVEGLVDALATTDPELRAAALEALDAIGERARTELLMAASKDGVAVDRRAPPSVIARALAESLAATARARWASELSRGIDRLRSGDWDEGVRALDRVYAAAPELYLARAEPIAAAYLARSISLHSRGNYDAALEAARTGLSIKRSKELAAAEREARLALARGFLEINELDRLAEVLEPLEASDGEATTLRARLFEARATRALGAGELARARQAIAKALALAPADPAIAALDRRIYVFENLAIVVALGLLVPGGALGVLVWLWRRAQAARLARAEAGIDRA